MFWFRKKSSAKKPNDDDLENNTTVSEKDDTGMDESPELSENNADDYSDDIADAEGDPEDLYEDEESGPDESSNGENCEDNAIEKEITDLTVRIGSVDDLAEFVNNRRVGGLQFMRKTSPEAFEIRESHIRMSRVWGSVSMSRECSPSEYAHVMLAMELTKCPDDFYVLPGLTEPEVKMLILEFCRTRYGTDGKKYARAPEKFSALINENGDVGEWKSFTKEAVYDKVADFCRENGIVFDSEGAQEDE